MKKSLIIAIVAAIPATAISQTIAERDFVDSTLTVPTSLLTVLGDTLVEGNNAGASYISQIYSPNLTITEDNTEVSVTFVAEGAGYRNTLGYFTYTENGDGSINILTRQLIFPNTSATGSNASETDCRR